VRNINYINSKLAYLLEEENVMKRRYGLAKMKKIVFALELLAIIMIISMVGFQTALAASDDSDGDDHSKKERMFSMASLKGEYVLIANGDGGEVGPEAIFGILQFNGKGEFNGQLVLNSGPAMSDRQVVDFEVSGVYSVANIGRGTLDMDQESFIFSVANSKYKNGVLLATKISFVMDRLSQTGNVVTGIIKKRHDKQLNNFNISSMDGDYGFINFGRGGTSPGIAIGNVNWNSDTEIVSGDFTVNIPGSESGSRVLFDFFSSGPYTVNQNGLGSTFSDTTGGSSRFLVTEATVEDGAVTAEEILFIPQFLDPVGNFSPAFITRIKNDR